MNCGTKFTDERWNATEPVGWDAPRDTHRHLCDACKQQVLTAERQADQAAPEHQELDQVVPEPRAEGGWFSQFRTGSG
ncbi:hypothetical protein AB0E78_40050 [Streptomyces sp. NPDC032198]|uniref:hypothetical protein n=1 Tax=Streptomyces sp. NPDC032198 TaxID=3155127 RepID=UPI0033C4CEF3